MTFHSVEGLMVQSHTNRYVTIAVLGLVALSGAVPAFSQARIDRREWMRPGTPTTDDPQRIPVRPAPKGPKGVTVLKGGRVFDSIRAEAYPATIVLENNKIKAILEPGKTDWPPDAKVLDVTGKTVMPGLIDNHVHLTYPNRDTPVDQHSSEGSGVLRGMLNMRYYVENGFTSVRDMGGVLNATFLLSEWMAANKAVGPRVFASGHIITGTGGHAADRPIGATHGPTFSIEVDGPMAWRAAVREMFKQGAAFIKIASHYSLDEVKAAVEEAHALGLKVSSDCESIYVQMAAEAGVDTIEHPLPRTDEAIKLMAKNGVAAIPTLQVYHALLEAQGGYYGTASRRFTMSSQQNFDMFKKMKAAGIKLGVGTDQIGSATELTPNNYIGELHWFVKGGFTKAEALMAATRINAEIIDMEDKIGSLKPGMLADLIVVDGKPDQDLDDLRRVETVIKDGFIVVDRGQILTPRHVPVPLANPTPPDTVK